MLCTVFAHSFTNTIRRPGLHVLDSCEPNMERYFMMGEDMDPVSFFILNRRNNPTINIYQFSSVYKSVIIQISEPVQLSKAERNP